MGWVILWMVITFLGSASIILILRLTRYAISVIRTNPTDVRVFVAIDQKHFSTDYLAATVSIAVSAAGEVIKLIIERNNLSLAALFSSLIILITLISGVVFVFFETSDSKDTYNTKAILWIAIICSFISLLIGAFSQAIVGGLL